MLESIKKDLIELNGKNVHIFGQPCILSYDDYLVKAADVCDALSDLECDLDESAQVLNAWNDEDNKNIVEVNAMNTYNYSGNIDRDIELRIIKLDGVEYGLISFHRFGDIRGNYTEIAVLKDDCSNDLFYEILEKINECDNTISMDVNGKTFQVSCSALNESIEVYKPDDDESITVYCIDDIPDEVTKRAALKEFNKNIPLLEEYRC